MLDTETILDFIAFTLRHYPGTESERSAFTRSTFPNFQRKLFFRLKKQSELNFNIPVGFPWQKCFDSLKTSLYTANQRIIIRKEKMEDFIKIALDFTYTPILLKLYETLENDYSFLFKEIYKFNKNTFLHMLLHPSRGHLIESDYKIIKLFCERGADPHCLNSDGLSPLHFAIIRKDFQAIQLCIEGYSEFKKTRTPLENMKYELTGLSFVPMWDEPEIFGYLISESFTGHYQNHKENNTTTLENVSSMPETLIAINKRTPRQISQYRYLFWNNNTEALEIGYTFPPPPKGHYRRHSF